MEKLWLESYTEASVKLEDCACHRPLPRIITKMTHAEASPRVTGSPRTAHNE